MIKRVVFVREVRDEDVELSVVVVVTRRRAHASLLAPILIYGCAGAKADLLKRAVAFVSVMEVRRRIVGDEDISQTIVVEVAADDAESVIAVRIVYACLF